MVHINLEGFDTQLEPMKAIAEVMDDWNEGFVNPREALGIVYAITCEWRY